MEGDGVGVQKLHYNREIASYNQADCCDCNGPRIDTQHHLILVNVGFAVLLVDFALPLGSERVATDVHEHEDQTNNVRPIRSA